MYLRERTAYILVCCIAHLYWEVFGEHYVCIFNSPFSPIVKELFVCIRYMVPYQAAEVTPRLRHYMVDRNCRVLAGLFGLASLNNACGCWRKVDFCATGNKNPRPQLRRFRPPPPHPPSPSPPSARFSLPSANKRGILYEVLSNHLTSSGVF